MDGFKHLVDTLSKPTILVTFTFAIFFFIFPPTDWFEKWHRRLKFDRLWSNKSLVIITGILVGFFVFGLTDSDFRAINDKNIAYGLAAIKNIGAKAANIISNNREKNG